MIDLTEKEKAEIAAFVAAVSAAFGFSVKRLKIQIREIPQSQGR